MDYHMLFLKEHVHLNQVTLRLAPDCVASVPPRAALLLTARLRLDQLCRLEYHHLREMGMPVGHALKLIDTIGQLTSTSGVLDTTRIKVQKGAKGLPAVQVSVSDA